MKTPQHVEIRLIKAEDDMAIKRIIEQVGREFGAIGEGFGPSDAEVSSMSQHYSELSGYAYYVATVEGQVVGGAGIAPMDAVTQTCELRKLFVLPNARGLSIGRKLSEACIEFAKSANYQQCYLDTLSSMQAAIALYKKLGFTQLKAPLAASEHNGCDVWMLKDLL
ncbi:GNAT family N-acetyltransferase [Alginatibacterium sediminis]|uniref:GNAT family N-acetyltransferase n=1 Tax=Alginatibacterium sediminis TaxID=2164068 RepID=A0A420EDM9_9ALTE|nr:GNAT family N-acetyltransferase [Alginatibacterium sediminis]RKF18807.1 GNAT family N-acetyltransferase [Alginatibacterium sediminis]